MLKTPIRSIAAAIALLALAAGAAHAEKAPLSEAQRLAEATHVIEGEVLAVYAFEEPKDGGTVRRSVAEVKVSRVEKGEGLEAGRLVYLRFWKMTRVVAPGASGQEREPRPGERVRAYLRRGEDGGLDALFPNGIEVAR
jgi:hypothetical protein